MSDLVLHSFLNLLAVTDKVRRQTLASPYLAVAEVRHSIHIPQEPTQLLDEPIPS